MISKSPCLSISVPLTWNLLLSCIDRYCWIVSKDGDDMLGVFMQFLVFYGPLWICSLYDLVAYGFIWRKQRLMVCCLSSSPLSSPYLSLYIRCIIWIVLFSPGHRVVWWDWRDIWSAILLSQSSVGHSQRFNESVISSLSSLSALEQVKLLSTSKGSSSSWSIVRPHQLWNFGTKLYDNFSLIFIWSNHSQLPQSHLLVQLLA
jgi:hypothetical protein